MLVLNVERANGENYEMANDNVEPVSYIAMCAFSQTHRHTRVPREKPNAQHTLVRLSQFIARSLTSPLCETSVYDFIIETIN